MTNNTEFCESIERSTSSQQTVKKRFDLWRQRLDAILDEDSKQPRCFSLELKQKLFDANPVCAICGQQISTLDDVAVDVLVPFCKGGQYVSRPKISKIFQDIK